MRVQEGICVLGARYLVYQDLVSFIFALFYCLLHLRSGECNVVSLYGLCCPVNGSVCFVCCVFDGVCELFGETIRNNLGFVCYFVVECVAVCGNVCCEAAVVKNSSFLAFEC